MPGRGRAILKNTLPELIADIKIRISNYFSINSKVFYFIFGLVLQIPHKYMRQNTLFYNVLY